MKRNSIVIAIVIGLFVGVVLPLQTYLANTSAYAYGLGRLLLEQLIFAVLFSALIWAALWISDRWLKGLLTPLLVAVLIMTYFASGPLAFGLPEINGELPDSLDVVSRKIWDAAIWLVVLAFAYVFRKMMMLRGASVAVAVLILGAASLLDIRHDEAETEGSRCGGYELSADIIDNVEYSPSRNVLLLILDNVDAQVATDIVTTNAALSAKFPGFTAYRNNIGMHDSTKLGVPGIMTGKFFEPGPGQLAKYIMSVFGTESALYDYQTAGAAIYAMFCTSSYGYTTAIIDPAKRRVKAEASTPIVLSRTAEVPYLSLADAVFFRTLPFVFKRQYLSTKLRQRDVIWNVDQRYDYEDTVYPILAQRPIAANSRPMFLKVHTHGAHGPYVPGVSNSVEATAHALKCLARLFDNYRERGIYDKSLIIVAADHGCGQESRRQGEPWKLRALLWVKAEGEKGGFVVTEMPTSHVKLSRILKMAAKRSPTSEECTAILKTDPRFYRMRDPDDRHGCIDYDVDSLGKATRR